MNYKYYSFQITNFIFDYPLKIDVTINIVNNVLLFENLNNKFFYNCNQNKKTTIGKHNNKKSLENYHKLFQIHNKIYK